MFGAVTPQEMHVASVLAALTMAAWLAVGQVPALRRHAGRIRAGLLAVYLAIGVGIIGFLLLR